MEFRKLGGVLLPERREFYLQLRYILEPLCLQYQEVEQ